MDCISKVGAYKIISCGSVIIEYYRGEINVNDLITLKKLIAKEPDYNFYSKTILDFRDASLVLDDESLIKITRFFAEKYKKSIIRRVAYLTGAPNEVVFTTLFSQIVQKNKILNFHPETFSTIDGVSKWLKIDLISSKDIENTIEELKTGTINAFIEKQNVPK